jgi:pectin methylesterase-like acyl-CoA thioesterase
MNGGTHTRPSFYFSGASLVLKNLTLKNTTVRGVKYITTVNPSNNTQAETIYFANGTNRTMAAFNCSFLSHQDTIQTTGKNWFYKCYIEGDTDFIWGTADVCLLEDCELVCVKDPNKTNNNDTILLVARTGSTAATAATVPKGYVLFKSRVKVEYPMTAYFSRNPGAGAYYDQAAVIDTAFTLEGTIAPAIWNTSVYTYLEGAPEHVGWKLYNNTVDGSPQNVSEMAANTNVIAPAVYNLEYNGRRTILNRVYKKSGGYEPAAAASVWDLSALESDFSASPDASASNSY